MVFFLLNFSKENIFHSPRLASFRPVTFSRHVTVTVPLPAPFRPTPSNMAALVRFVKRLRFRRFPRPGHSAAFRQEVTGLVPFR